MCSSGKVRHKNKIAACIAAKRFRDSSLNVYKCNACSGWHVGHSNNPLRKMGRMDQLFRRIREKEASHG